MDSKQRIMDFLGCWHRRDLDGLLGFLAEGAVFQPDPKAEPVQGREAIARLWTGYLKTITSYDATIRLMVADERHVAVERLERLHLTEDRQVTLPIVGIFELDAQGQITAWRDYWDTATPN